jgi:UDP-GlcNAc:undecaprenyl-phosphate GlcNAc-1-phosphate transferase
MLEMSVLGFMSVTALMLTMLFMPLAIKFSTIVNAIDLPDSRKMHDFAMPRLGGFAITIAFIICILFFIPFDTRLQAFLVGLVIITLLGLADDIYQLPSSIKFVFQIAATLAFILTGDYAIDSFGDLLGTGPVKTGHYAVPITVFCMVGVINALNLSDGLDGLAGGLSLIACLFLGYFAIFSGEWLCLALVTALFGCLIGFLYFNSHPAKVFMGDTGSLVLGYTLCSICLMFKNTEGAQHVAPISMALILALPILDTMFVMTRRLVYGENPFNADNTHLHHRLMSLNLPHTVAVSVMYISMFIYGLLAVFMEPLPEWLQFATGWAYIFLLFGTVIILQRLGFKIPDQLFIEKTDKQAHQFYNHISELLGKSVSVITWMIPVLLLIPVLFFPSIQSGFMVTSFITCVVIIALFPWKKSHERAGWIHGLIYIATFMILVILNLIGPMWTHEYLVFITWVIFVWVVVKLVFKGHDRVILTSNFELLMIAVSWFIPMILTRVVAVSADVQQSLVHACIQAIPFLLAMKIIINKEPQKNRTLVVYLAGIFFIIGLRQMYAMWH